VTAGGDPLLSVRGLFKAYAAPVLSGIDLDLRAGEAIALVGANGAGKSTLARIVCGLARPDAGTLALGGVPFAPVRKADAERAGVQIVQQELTVVPTLSVAENLFLARLPRRRGLVDRARLRADARAALDAVGLADVDPDAPAGRLGVGHQQLVEIAGALARPCRVLILDEPTAALTDPQAERLFAHLARLKAAGVGLIYVSHRMDELRRVADRVVILRDGRLVADEPIGSLSPDEMVRRMVGREDVEALADHPISEPGPVVLRVENLSRGPLVRGVSFEAHAGEILGIGGLVGSGRTELLRAVFGAEAADGGAVYVGGDGPFRFRSPRAAVRAGLALVPEDRKRHGLLLPRPMRENVTLGRLGRFAGRAGWVRGRAEAEAADDQRERLSIRCQSVEQPVGELSGGNQQKAVIGRWLLADARAYLFDEPTRGVDAAARAEVHRLLRGLAGRGRRWWWCRATRPS
jgi:ribose transport system ATP-binding protein